jgi:hypothetical protein
MRQSITLLILILIASAVYTVYGLTTFEPDRPPPFVFNEPKMPADLTAIEQGIAAESNAGLTPAQQQQKAEAVAQVSQAISLYQGYEKESPQQSVSTLGIINTAVVSGRLPAYFLSGKDEISGKRKFELLSVNTANNLIIEPKAKKLACTTKMPPIDFLIGDETDNALECDLTNVVGATGDKVILAGPGNDTVLVGTGSKIINAGSGDDMITAGSGRLILVLEPGWGKDTLTVDCAGAKVLPEQIPEFSIPWSYDTVNFILLSPQINAGDVVWEGNVLKNRLTDDTLTVSENCLAIVSAGVSAEK